MSRGPSASSEASVVTGVSSDASSDDPGEGPSNYYRFTNEEDDPSSEDDYL